LNRTKSPLATQPTSLTNSPVPREGLNSEWDYSETAFWGYVILIITWLVFVVGMGSCFDVWSWAWDVGEKPETLPELEDDPTLPIVGYYPALLVLTCVMAWVWVVAAWVGMKYFRHADLRDGG
jgi:Phosphatidylinositol N-acetylglucosaminyltransferase subunit Y